MRDAFWGTYNTIAFKVSYYKVYQGYAETRLFWSRVICACVSILSVLIWGISKSLPVLWACLIALAQLAQTLIGFLPWAQQAAALRYLVPELDKLLVDIYRDWLRLGYESPEDKHALAERSAEYQRRFYELANQYTADIWFPVRKQIALDAENDSDKYFKALFPPTEGANGNENRQELSKQKSEPQTPCAVTGTPNLGEGKSPSAE